jgi:hypothetical protein
LDDNWLAPSRRERREKVSSANKKYWREVHKDKRRRDREAKKTTPTDHFTPSEVTSLEVATGANAGKTGKVCAEKGRRVGVAKVTTPTVPQNATPSTHKDKRRRDRVGKKSEMTRLEVATDCGRPRCAEGEIGGEGDNLHQNATPPVSREEGQVATRD